MINKKFIFANLFFTILILFGTQAQARGVTFTATVTYTNSTSDSIHTIINANKYTDCITRRDTAINNPPLRYWTSNATSCTPIIDLNKLVDLKKPIIPDVRPFPFPFPWPPICLNGLSCPPDFKEKILEHIYPDDYKQVQQLMDKYNVEAFNKEVLELQQNYDFEGFEKELSEIENNIENK